SARLFAERLQAFDRRRMCRLQRLDLTRELPPRARLDTRDRLFPEQRRQLRIQARLLCNPMRLFRRDIALCEELVPLLRLGQLRAQRRNLRGAVDTRVDNLIRCCDGVHRLYRVLAHVNTSFSIWSRTTIT